MKEKKNIIYYDIRDDINKYPDCWLYVIYSARGPGKTYSSLRMCIDDDIKFVFMKRTIEDCKLLCTCDDETTDFSPFKPLNRDLGWDIHPKAIKDGIGAFYNRDSEGNIGGKPYGFILSLSAVRKFKGFDLSEADWIIFDEFIPERGERLNRREGEQLLNFYMTVARDRDKRGKKPLKLILLANAVEISTPVANELEIVDTMADMQADGQAVYYDEDRLILLHHLIEPEYKAAIENSPIYKAMKHTAWGKMSFEGDFAFNDFSNVQKISLKGMKPLIKLHHKTYDYYIYLREYDGMYYMCSSKNRTQFEYDLNKENDQKKFYLDFQLDLREACIEDSMKFQKYTMYDLIINYKKFFTL